MRPSLKAGLVLLGLCLVAGGCREGRSPAAADPAPVVEQPVAAPPPGPAPGGTADRPLVVAAVARIGETSGTSGWSLGELDCRAGGEVTVGLEQFWLAVRLEPVPDPAWFSKNVRVEPAGLAQPRADLFAYGMVDVFFPRGEPGDRMTVTLTAVTLSGREDDSLTVTLRRVEEPRATLEVAEGGGWREVLPGEVLRQRPLKLRIRFTREMDRETVENRMVRQTFGWGPWGADIYGPPPGRITWADGRTLLWEIDDPPPALWPSVMTARDVDGLWVLGGLPVVYTGEPPRLYARQPATGREEVIGRVPTDLHQALVSPDGRILLALGYEVTTRRDRPPAVAWLVDPFAGEWRRLDGTWTYPGWVGDGALLRVRSGAYQVVDLAGNVLRQGPLPDDYIRLPSLSPDGSRLAFLVTDLSTPRAEGDYRLPQDLAVVDLETGDISWTRDFIRFYMPPTDWIVLAGPAWSPDGERVAALTDLERGSAIRVLRLETGEVSTPATLPELEERTTGRFAWSPDGRFWLAGDRLVAADPPHQVSRGGWRRHGPLSWSPDGRWLVQGDWTGTRLYQVEDGSAEDLGAVLPCGWDASGRLYLVRWPDAEHRYVPSEP